MSEHIDIQDPMDPARLARAERDRAFKALDSSGQHAFLIGEGHNLSANDRLAIINGKLPLPLAPRVSQKSTESASNPASSSPSKPSFRQGAIRDVSTPSSTRLVKNAIHRSGRTGLPSIIKAGSWTMGTENVVIPSGREDIPDAIARIEDAPSRARGSSRQNA